MNQAFARKFAISAFSAAALLFSGMSATTAQAQQAMTKVNYQEPTRALFYAPSYVAMNKNFFKEAGLDVSFQTAAGGDKIMAALLTGGVDIALLGPEYPLYIWHGQSPLKIKIVSGLAAADGTFLVKRGKGASFDWADVKGKKILGWRKGSTPTLFLEEALRMNKVNPNADVEVNNNTAIPARFGAFMAGTGDYAIFFEPDASRLEREGVATIVKSIGETVGQVDYTVFVASDDYIKKNPQTVQAWTNSIYKAQRWIDKASVEEIADAIASFFPGIERQDLVSSVKRYREKGLWKKDPLVKPEAITKLEEILIAGETLKSDQRVKYENVVAPQFANEAIKAAQ
ncbi:MAG TPA: ABC transporter substrate-binding protein [Xanthobacteraceae bacterium]|nr:ABC transporter substrate-binding protein [Xanthobacteraceae bacterium]